MHVEIPGQGKVIGFYRVRLSHLGRSMHRPFFMGLIFD